MLRSGRDARFRLRYERPQKGRFREFHQLDAEIIGAAEPQADVELLSLGSSC